MQLERVFAAAPLLGTGVLDSIIHAYPGGAWVTVGLSTVVYVAVGGSTVKLLSVSVAVSIWVLFTIAVAVVVSVLVTVTVSNFRSTVRVEGLCVFVVWVGVVDDSGVVVLVGVGEVTFLVGVNRMGRERAAENWLDWARMPVLPWDSETRLNSKPRLEQVSG